MPEGVSFLELVQTLGVPVCVAAYYMYKDWKQSEKILGLIGRVEALLDRFDSPGDKD